MSQLLCLSLDLPAQINESDVAEFEMVFSELLDSVAVSYHRNEVGKWVIEALFHGNDDYDFEPDPGAVVIWFSDDPSLNEQSRYRLLETADRLNLSDLEVVQNSFNREN